jgi:hypothetical protein
MDDFPNEFCQIHLFYLSSELRRPSHLICYARVKPFPASSFIIATHILLIY